MLNAWRKRNERKLLAERICAAVSARSRAPVFFRALGVPDTIDGRFDLLALHAWLVLEKLQAAGRRDLAQAVTDRLFTGFDEGLRDLGAGDIGMSRRMKKFASAFFGRMKAYSAASDEAELAAAIDRNLFRGTGSNDSARMLALYARLSRIHLCRADVAAGELDFGPLPND
ncbi:MAG: ubiquinol-cytochrome C chaperone family protein [Rhizomicrobium sp.]